VLVVVHDSPYWHQRKTAPETIDAARDVCSEMFHTQLRESFDCPCITCADAGHHELRPLHRSQNHRAGAHGALCCVETLPSWHQFDHVHLRLGNVDLLYSQGHHTSSCESALHARVWNYLPSRVNMKLRIRTRHRRVVASLVSLFISCISACVRTSG
jgi:hypothetical protein